MSGSRESQPRRRAALVVAGHGSTLNADSSTPTYRHADRIREQGLFAEVHECFWKEEPNFRFVLDQVEAERVYIVPDFISSGYFTEEVIPRELGLEPGSPITRRDGKTLCYCEPVGLHPSMTDVLLERAAVVVRASGVPPLDPETTALFVIGHGTGLNENSTKIVYEQAARIAALRPRPYAACHAAFMEQAPFIKEWRTIAAQPNVVAVPFFISDGLHSYEDIPVLLGMTENVREQGVLNPHAIDGRRLWYAPALGTDPRIADVIVAQVDKFDALHFANA
ncbi:sirohydrochlorin cobaltochelatase [Verrucomicrobium sp. GAS474]|uniref:CbiX/SirB N-terminal domain-containing protein n=1 Tax=Verrucomicrobium sp. GAS474 TaxID=1882831 RepID=UPI00087D89DE|nr:CbiX/SirB N-terminal domain-containing protein [Verrucomicrobium sp. GAS474]SDU01808.1 sirohydrochlorin cobaltochelatase [Verrucomicrobium sp. GAS474]